MTQSNRIRVALRNDYEVVVHGLKVMLEPYADQIELSELDINRSLSRPVDITLYDTFSQPQVDAEDIDRVVADPNAGAVVIYTWNMQPALADQAIAKGCRGYLDKSLAGFELVEVLRQIHAGATVVSPTHSSTDSTRILESSWPGRAEGLSAREAEVVALITQGLTNTDIAARSYLSINSVKSYIRSAYRKMGVARRSQAVRWGIEHGMLQGNARYVIAE